MPLTTRKPIGTIGFLGGIPAVPTPFAFSLLQLGIYSQEALCQPSEYVAVDYARFSLHDSARNELVSRMEGDWLFQLDADMVVDPDVCARLVMHMYRHDLDVITGLYAYKSGPMARLPVLYQFNESVGLHEIIGDWDRTADLFGVDSAGGGILLVRKRAFDRIKAELKEEPFTRIPSPQGLMGEDHSFFARLRKVGMKGYCAWKVQAAHLAYEEVLPSLDYSKFPVLNRYERSAIPGSESEVHGGSLDRALINA